MNDRPSHPIATPPVAAIYGTFDVENFGDLLFPIVAQAQLRPHGWQVVPVSPTNLATSFSDALPPCAVGEMLHPSRLPQAVLIGGGEIIHDWPADFLKEYREAGVDRSAYLSLWFGAALTAAIADAPIAWNAPGVVAPMKPSLRRRTLAPAILASDYLCVRDDDSATFIGRDASAKVVPDTVASLARIWPKPTLDPAFRLFRERKQLSGEVRLLAVHVRPGASGRNEDPSLAPALDAFALSRQLTPVLIAIGPSLNDAAAVVELSAELTVPHVKLDDPQSLAEVASVLANSTLYIGHSMHGYVVSASYDVPGVIVARSGFRKYRGFARHLGREGDVVRDWEKAFCRGIDCLAARQGEIVPPAVHEALDRHWQNVATAFGNPAAGRQRRLQFLRNTMADVVNQQGLSRFLNSFHVR